ncbi:MAG: hypothetical protein AAGI01_17115, partial [Myxococcota bacterium]
RAFEVEGARLVQTGTSQMDMHAHEALMGYSRTVIDERAEGLGYTSFEYFGPLDARTRDFCRHRVGRTFTREQIAGMDNGQEGDVFTRGGGWRCRHHWRPVRREWGAGRPRTRFSTERPTYGTPPPWDGLTLERVEDYIREFDLGTPLTQRMARALERGEMELMLLSDADFALQMRRWEIDLPEFFPPDDPVDPQSVYGFSIFHIAMVRAETPEAFMTAIHECVHVLQYLDGSEATDAASELREEIEAYGAEYDYAVSRGWRPAFSSRAFMVEWVEEVYGGG